MTVVPFLRCLAIVALWIAAGPAALATGQPVADNAAPEPRTPVPALQPGQPAPDFALPDLAGESSHSLAELRGTAVLMMFWVSWVPGCVHMGDAHLERIRGSLTDVPFRVVIVGNSYRDTADRQAAMVAERGWECLALFDDDLNVTRAFGAKTPGWLVLLDEDGRVVASGDTHESLAVIESWLGQHFSRTIATAGHQTGPSEADEAIGWVLRAAVLLLAVIVVAVTIRQRVAARRTAHTQEST